MNQSDDQAHTPSLATRFALVLVSALLFVAMLNNAFEWGLVGPYAKQAMALMGLVAFVALYCAGAFTNGPRAATDEQGSQAQSKPHLLLIAGLWCFAIGLVLVVNLGPRYLRGEQVSLRDWIIVSVLLAAAVWIWHRGRNPKS